MKDDVEARLARIEALQRAHTNLLLAHIVAADTLIEGLAATTTRFAEDQRDAALAAGDLAGVLLTDLIRDIRVATGLPEPS